MRTICFLAGLFGFILAPKLHGQVPVVSPSLEPITIDDGLSQGYVSCMLQDRKGFMWFGTLGGLNRYDGHNFKVFSFEPNNPYSLSGNNVFALYEDQESRIWIGTHGQGLCVYDPNTERIHRITGTGEAAKHLTTLQIKAISHDHLGQLWVGGHSDNQPFGLYKVEVNWPDSPDHPAYLKSRISRFQLEHDSLFLNNNVYTVHSDSQYLWIGTDWGLYSTQPGEKEIQFKVHTAPLHQDGRPYSGVFSILPGEEKLWLGRSGSIQILNTKTNKLLGDIPPFPGIPWVSDLQMDKYQQLWFTDYRGSGATMISRDSVTYGRSLPPTVLGGIASLLVDRSDVIWFGTKSRGLYKFSPGTNRFNPLHGTFVQQQNQYVGQLFEDQQGRLWVNNEVLDRKTGILSRPDFLPRPRHTIHLEEAPNGILWGIIGPGLLWSYNPKTKETKQYNLGASVIVDGPIHVDSSGLLWCGVAGTLYRFAPSTQQLETFVYNPSATANQVGSFIFSIAHDASGNLWMGTQQGLVRFDKSNQTFKVFRHDPGDSESLGSDRVLCILQDPLEPNRFLWLGTEGGGLNRLDRMKGTFIRITTTDGLSDNTVYGLLADESNRLWMSTNHGLSRYDPVKETFRNYDVGDGLQSNEFNRLAFAKGTKGELFFGGVYGLNAFYPDQIEDNPHVPPVVITGFRIKNLPVSHLDSLSPLTSSITESSEIYLDYDQNMIAFEYAALDFTNPGKNQYAYQLEGLDEHWIEAGNSRLATFTNLDPGIYTFRVKASNNDGLWNESGASINLIIAPPWWQTWWSITLYAILAIITIALLLRLRIRRIQLKNQLNFEQKEAQRVRELELMKSQFFSNITHEFRTPLTLILGPVETLLEKNREKSDERQLKSIRDHGQRLLRLINQLLDLSKLESMKMEAELERGNLGSFVQRVTDSYQPTATLQSIRLLYLPPLSLREFDFDAGKLEKISHNLLANAIKFTPEGGKITVRLTDLKKNSDGSWVELSVADNGSGIPANDLPHIFDRFYQVKGNETIPGSGIGLALCKELTGTFGGHIDVESAEGKGSCFTVHIPFEIQDEQEALSVEKGIAKDTHVLTTNDVPPVHVSIGEDEPVAAPNLVLIVEDHDELRSFIRSSLTTPHRILEASNGKMGLDAALAQVPDLIISDVMMPEMDGYELCKLLKQDERTSHIPIILLTARASLDSRLQGLEEGADAYLTKPFSKKELNIRIRKLLEGRKLLQQKYQQSTWSGIENSQLVSVPNREKAFLQKAEKVAFKFLDDSTFNVDLFCKEMAMSRTQLHRKLSALTSQSATGFVRSIRLNVARELLLKNDCNVTEVAYAVGFSSQTYFSRCFQEKFGFPPSQIGSTPHSEKDRQ